MVEDFSCIVLGIDEVNNVFDINLYEYKALFTYIGSISCSFDIFFVPIIAEPVIGPIQSMVSKFTHPPLPLHIPLQLLSYECCLIALNSAIALSFLSIFVVAEDNLPDFSDLTFLKLSEYGLEHWNECAR